MADFEDEGSANLAHGSGFHDDAAGYEDPNLGPEAAQYSKLSEPSASPFDAYSAQPSSMMADNEYDASAYQQDPLLHHQQQQQQQGPPANEASPADYSYREEQPDDMPANFAREAARGQDFQGEYEGEPLDQGQTSGRGDEVDEMAQQDSHPNPFQDSGVAGGHYMDNDRPIMGYNPFLNEEKQKAEEDESAQQDQFEDRSDPSDYYQQQGYGAPSQGSGQEEAMEREIEGQDGYDRLEEDEDADDADLQMEPVGEIQQPPAMDMMAEEQPQQHEELTEERRMEDDVQPPVSFTEDELHSEQTGALESEQTGPLEIEQTGPLESEETGPLESEQTGPLESEESRVPQYTEDQFDQEELAEDQRDDLDREGFQAPVAGGIAELERKEFEDEEKEEETVAEPVKSTEEEDLGIVNQGFVDGEAEGEIISEAEKVESEIPGVAERTEADVGFSPAEHDDHGIPESDRGEQQIMGGEQEGIETQPQIEQEEIKEQTEEQEEKEQPIDYDEEERREVEEEEYKEREEIEDKHSAGLAGEFDDAEQMSRTAEDYTSEQLRSGEEEKRMEETEPCEKDFGSRLPDSDMLSSEERSFVDNLSELTSPDTIPQPLPSPPEPKDMSPFDPLAPSDSTSPCHEAGGNLGQHEALFQHGVVAEENNAGDFLTAGEVEGETKFGVDGTAITSTASQNNAFLHSDDEDEEEEEEESQPLEQGGLQTAGTTETETSVDEKSGEFGGQGFEPMETANDNALMSMSMEGSFYDDGGELIGGDDRKNSQQENHVYQDDITEETISQPSQQDGYEQKQDGYLFSQDEFGQQVQSDYSHSQESFPPSQEESGISDSFAADQDSFDPLQNATAPPESAVNGGLDSLLDAPVIAQGLQTPVTEQSSTVDSSVDNVGLDSIAREFESSVDTQPPPSMDKGVEDDLGIQISEPAAPEKAEEPSSSVDEAVKSPAPVEEQKIAEVAAAAAPAAVTGAAGAAAAASATTKSTTTVKKSSAKAGSRTTTTTTTTKTVKETKSSGARTTSKKTETATSTTTAKTSATTTSKVPSTKRPPFDSRPITANERKAKEKAAASPTKSAAAPTSAKSAGPLPSYAQPITPRKPREPKIPTPEEKKKTTPTSTTPRAASATTPRTPRPQSATTGSSTKTTTTTTKTTTYNVRNRTAELARPKSSPTKMTNGTAAPTDNKSPTKKPTTTTTARPKPAAPGTFGAAKSPQKPTSPRTPTTKSGEVKSKIGSMDNATHSPGGGTVKITTKKTDYSNVTSRVGSKDKMDHKPGGGNVRIENKKVKVEARSKIGSLDNATHKAAGGDKKIEVQKTEWKAQSKVGSLHNAKHKPGGGDKKIESHKLEFKDKASPKIGSLDKVRAGSGSEEGGAHEGTEVAATNGATSDN